VWGDGPYGEENYWGTLRVKGERKLKFFISFKRGNRIVSRESKREGAHFAKVGDCGPRLKKR